MHRRVRDRLWCAGSSSNNVDRGADAVGERTNRASHDTDSLDADALARHRGHVSGGCVQRVNQRDAGGGAGSLVGDGHCVDYRKVDTIRVQVIDLDYAQIGLVYDDICRFIGRVIGRDGVRLVGRYSGGVVNPSDGNRRIDLDVDCSVRGVGDGAQ